MTGQTWIISIISVVFIVFTASAATIHIPGDYPTFQAAVDAAQPGDTILVADGVYSGSGNFDISCYKDLTFKSENGPANCTIDPQQFGRAIDLYNSDAAVHLEGFTYRNCRYVSPMGRAVGGAIHGNNELTLDSCIFYNNTVEVGSGEDNAGGGAVYLANRVTNCVFYENTASADTYSYGGALASVTHIENCTFLNNNAEVDAAISGGQITNCIIRGNPTDLLWGTCSFCNVEGGYEGEGNFDLDPGFVSLNPFDFHLLPDSPCINTGVDTGIGYDIDGDLRPEYGAFDVGADEFTGAWASPTPTPTVTPTITPSPTVTPTPTKTPYLHIELEISDTQLDPGDDLLLEAHVINPGPESYSNQPFVVLMEIAGMHFWFPNWQPEFDYAELYVGVGAQNYELLNFEWPDLGGSSGQVTVYAALLTEDFSSILGGWDMTEFGW